MNARTPLVLGIAIVAGMCVASAGRVATAQTTAPATLDAPDYGSGVAAGPLSDQNFNTPESDGRPGVKFFAYAVQAYREHDYAHAVDMYKLAAYWAYAPAAYNLGVMYFEGQGVPVDRPLGAAWMVIAAQQGNPRYGLVRDRMVTVLTHAEFAEADRAFGRLAPKYGEQVTLRRAKARWAFAKSQKTGSRVGGTSGELNIGFFDAGANEPNPGKSGRAGYLDAGFRMMSRGSAPGALAYRQLQESSNPYSTRFLQMRKGNATVGPLHAINGKAGRGGSSLQPAPASSAGSAALPPWRSTIHAQIRRG